MSDEKKNTITQAQIDALLDASDVLEHVFWGKELVVSYMLPCGFSILGRAACVDPMNFDMEIGRDVARKDAANQLWQLEGYVLQLYLAGFLAEPVDVNELAAMVAHEVNRAYCAAIGDGSQVPWDDAPEWQRESCRAGVQAHRKANLSPVESHERWMQHKALEGWKYGPEKDPEAKTHPCMVPFEQLPKEQQIKENLYTAVMQALL